MKPLGETTNHERSEGPRKRPGRLSRRRVLQAGGLGAAAMAARPVPTAARPKTARPARRPNFLLILCDQLGLDAIGAHGFRDARTPNLDRLIRRGTTFMESHTTNPVCSPARSSLMTGCMPVETGVITNGRPIHAGRANLGQWLGGKGYESVYCGKWHLPHGYQAKIDGFTVLPAGMGQGDLLDTAVSNACAAWIKDRRSERPYLMVASFLQPHDICYWGNARANRMPKGLGLPFEQLRGHLPKLPPNHTSRPKAPEKLDRRVCREYSEDMWRYYLYLYARQVEMLDADVGRVLDAVEAAGQADSTVILFTADHGDGRARHMHVSKWYPYDEAVKVPMIVSCPGRITQGGKDTTHLVMGLDVMATLCDYAGVAPPETSHGLSLRPLLENRSAEWRRFVVSEFMVDGRMVRSPRYKYVAFKGDPVEMLFDMEADPWETKNLYEDRRCAKVLAEHRKMLTEFQAQLRPVEPTPTIQRRRPPKPRKRRPQ
jgi:arylsulfatase A-like enzyme